MSASETKWVRLGEYIEQSDKRNSDGALTETDVQGISTDKCFIPTKANLDGVSVLSYKIVALSEFAYVADTSRRGDKVALALNSSEKNILISSIYTVFHSTDENILLPEYMFLLFNRSEFDRYSDTFRSVRRIGNPSFYRSHTVCGRPCSRHDRSRRGKCKSSHIFSI